MNFLRISYNVFDLIHSPPRFMPTLQPTQLCVFFSSNLEGPICAVQICPLQSKYQTNKHANNPPKPKPKPKIKSKKKKKTSKNQKTQKVTF